MERVGIKYADHGIGELDDLRVLEVPPLPEYDSPVEIAAGFGGSARSGRWWRRCRS